MGRSDVERICLSGYGQPRVRDSIRGMTHPFETLRFVSQTIRAFEASLRKAKEKLAFYEKAAKADPDSDDLKLTVRIHRDHVKLQKLLLKSARQKAHR